MRYQIWNKTDDIYTPSGAHFTAEQWAERYPWVKIPGAKMVITTGMINGKSVAELEDFKAMYAKMGAAITDGMSEQEALAAIEEFEDNPPVSTEPTIEERTAAALEFLAINSLPDDEI